MTTPATTPADGELHDDFRGDDAQLISCIKALISMNDAGALVPHGIGGHARALLSAAAVRLYLATPSPGKAQEPVAWHIGNADGTINSIGAVYIRRSLAEKHIASYEDGEIDAAIVPLYASPGKADTERFAFLIDRGLELIACECEVGPPRMWTLGGLSQSIGWFPTQREAIDAAVQQERDKQ